MESLEKTLRVRKQEADAVKVLLKRDRCAQPPVMRMLVLKISRPRTKPSPPPPALLPGHHGGGRGGGQGRRAQ